MNKEKYEELIRILDEYKIPHENGNLYDDEENVVGYWIDIRNSEILFEKED